MRLLILALTFISSFAQAQQVDLKNIQVKCVDRMGDVAFVGNNTQISDMNTELIVYAKTHDGYQLTEHSNQTLIWKKSTSQNGVLEISSDKVKIEMGVYIRPFAWNNGTINQSQAKCTIDSQFFQTLQF